MPPPSFHGHVFCVYQSIDGAANFIKMSTAKRLNSKESTMPSKGYWLATLMKLKQRDYFGKIFMESVRWAVNFSVWKPTQNEWIKAIQCIQSEEKERISRFVYAKDTKASLIGRLLMRKLFVDKFDISNLNLKLGRNDKEKPYIINDLPPSASCFSFNVSHQGSFTVLAAEYERTVGIDVMKVEYAGGKSVSEFFRTMDRQFTEEEWKWILSGDDEKEKMTNFYRNWCLKESYVKAIGVGIGFNLKRLNFIVKTSKLHQRVVTTDTQLQVDNSLARNWQFQETMLDDEHCVAVALGPKINSGDEKKEAKSDLGFTILNFDEIIKSLQPIYLEDFKDWEQFNEKS